MKDEVALLYTTWPDAESVAPVARQVIEERLCACVNILGPLRSVYRWEGAVEEAVEIPALFKTAADRAPALRDRIAALHPYDTPCILMIPITSAGSHAPFMAWLNAATRHAGL